MDSKKRGFYSKRHDSILNILPKREFNFFEVFKIIGRVTLSSGEPYDNREYGVKITKWHDKIAFKIHHTNIIAEENDDQIYFRMWDDDSTMYYGGVMNKYKNLVKLYSQHINREPKMMVKDTATYLNFTNNEMTWLLPIVDIFKMINNIQFGHMVACGNIDGVNSKIFRTSFGDKIKTRIDRFDQQIKPNTETVDYLLYYDDRLSLYAFERINSDGIVIRVKIFKRYGYLKDEDMSIFNQFVHMPILKNK
jgi:hypothetical protein